MIKISVDEKQLRKSLQKASKEFGDTTQQAVARLSVQLARDLAYSTQDFGQKKDQQQAAIEAGMKAVVMPLKRVRKKGRTVVGTLPNGKRITWPNSRFLDSVNDVNKWIDSLRTRRRGRTPSGLPFTKRAATTPTTFRKVLTMRKKKAGIAKGGWIGAGKAASKFQRGGKALRVGKNFISYAHKHSNFGRAKRGRDTITLQNKSSHSKSPYVLSLSQIRKDMRFASQKTLEFYENALSHKLNK